MKLQYRFYKIPSLTFIVIGIFLFGTGGNLHGQQTNEEQKFKPQKVYGKDHPLVNIVDVVQKDSLIIALTSEFPSIHVFKGSDYMSWGGEGNGPGEFNSPRSIKVEGSTIYVLDFRTGSCKIVSYNLEGDYLSSSMVRGYMCHDFDLGGGYKMVEVGNFGSQEKKIVNLVDDSLETVISFTEPDPVNIQTPEGPMNNFSFPNPFIGRPMWTLNNKGELIRWNGKDDSLSVINISTGRKKLIAIPKSNEIKIRSAAVEEWINDRFSTNKTLFGIENFYKGVRNNAKEQTNIPDYYSLLYDIKIDPNGGIWLLNTIYGESGQIWTYLSPENKRVMIQLPAGRKLATISKKYITATKKDSMGVELIELYNRHKFLSKFK